MRARRAISLVELLLAMSACAVILTMSTALIHRMLLAQSKARTFLDSERTSLRLAHQFRGDVQDATDAATEKDRLGEGVFMRLSLPDNRTVEYRSSAPGVVRVLTENSTVRSREEFAFPASIEVAAEKQPLRIIRLSIASQTKQQPRGESDPRATTDDATVGLQAEAVLGRRAPRRVAAAPPGGAP
jgi:hypothetical protein